ncbi:uncharacterized protein PG986_006223 [Apiospora aurea]|uniref:2EXR domain-containing protein n=1 Tax=Apiospora aurea TaxID=335848 RepID=A0ABR1QJU1_9PEZI
MNTFTIFQKLPTELQLQVWEHAIGNEATTRRVPVDDFAKCIYPHPRLISPLLTACRGSRQVALSHYRDPIPIHDFEVAYLSERDLRENPVVFRERVSIIHPIMADDGIGPAVMAQYKPYHAKRQGERIGVLRVSFASDTFVDGKRYMCRKVMDPYFENAHMSKLCCDLTITPQLDDSQYNQVIRTLNEDPNRLPPDFRRDRERYSLHIWALDADFPPYGFSCWR